MNPVLAKHNPQWFAEIKEVDESIFVGDELFRKSRPELQELRDRMQKMAPEVQQSNNAVAKYRFSVQWQTLEIWQHWLDWHLSFDSSEGYKLLEWIKQREGDVPVTVYLLDQAYARLKSREPAPEPELPPTIVRQPADVSVAPGELATFSVEVSGSKPLTYQWIVAGRGEIPGAIFPRYQTVATEYSDGNLYFYRISNKYGSINSYRAELRMSK